MKYFRELGYTVDHFENPRKYTYSEYLSFRGYETHYASVDKLIDDVTKRLISAACAGYRQIEVEADDSFKFEYLLRYLRKQDINHSFRDVVDEGSGIRPKSSQRALVINTI